jgi:hypothetical protein
VQKKADTYPAVLYQILPQSKQSKWCCVRSKLVACGAPGHGGKFRKFLENSFRITYTASNSVTLEGTGINLEITIKDRNSSTLKVPCDAPGIGAKKVQEISKTSLELLTTLAVLLWKVLSWISTFSPYVA